MVSDVDPDIPGLRRDRLRYGMDIYEDILVPHFKGDKKMAKKDMYYYNAFVRLVDHSCDAAALLIATMTDYRPEELEQKMKEMHKIEHECDIEKHHMMEKLAKEFITPIEREDIMEMANQIDNVTDSIEDVLMRMYMFNITIIRKDALEVAHIIEKCCHALKKALEEVP